MGHKNSKALLALSLIAIVIPLASRVNHPKQSAPGNASSPVCIADGNPGPPLPPPPSELGMQSGAESFVIADGNPGPPLPPPTNNLGQVASEYTA